MVDVWGANASTVAHPAPNESQETAEKVLRRAHIARVVTSLKSRLALATFKTQRGLESCNFEALEALALNGDSSSSQSSKASSPFSDATSNKVPAGPRYDVSPPHLKAPFQKLPHRGLDLQSKAATESMPPPPLRGYSPDKRDFTAYVGGPQNRRQLISNLSRGSPIRQQPPMPSLGAALTPTASTANSAPQRRKRAKTLDQGTPTAKTTMTQSASMPNGLQNSLRSDDGPVVAPSTPPPSSGPIPALPSTPTSQLRSADQEGANLLLYLATSPGRSMPCTPRTPDFHLNEYCNIFTPSPGRSHIPHHPMTPSSINRARQHLNFENS